MDEYYGSNQLSLASRKCGIYSSEVRQDECPTGVQTDSMALGAIHYASMAGSVPVVQFFQSTHILNQDIRDMMATPMEIHSLALYIEGAIDPLSKTVWAKRS